VLRELELPTDSNLIAGLATLDDAGVYRLSDDLAVVQAVDYFTPIVDDPYTFGQIAAANALSDVYAMGGRPVTAMNIVCFPREAMDFAVLREILRGGLDKLGEAEVTLVGGHSVDDPELKYGLAVTGLVHPDRVVLNAGARPGDRLILTKPLGTGLVNTAIKAGMAEAADITAATEQMVALNRTAAELMQEAGVHACTDVTGFGLLGHAGEMAQASGVGLELRLSAIPILTGAIGYARSGLIPAGTYRNRDYRAGMVAWGDGLPGWASDLLFDPQTSGGLLIALPSGAAENLLARMHRAGLVHAALVGAVRDESAARITIAP
jgi:selenide,water dikinase